MADENRLKILIKDEDKMGGLMPMLKFFRAYCISTVASIAAGSE